MSERLPQVRVQDGRVLVGQLSCLDKQGNIILATTVQVPGSTHAGAPMLHCVLEPELLRPTPQQARSGRSVCPVVQAERSSRLCCACPGGAHGLPQRAEERLIGLVLIPLQQRVSCEVEVRNSSVCLLQHFVKHVWLTTCEVCHAGRH